MPVAGHACVLLLKSWQAKEKAKITERRRKQAHLCMLEAKRFMRWLSANDTIYTLGGEFQTSTSWRNSREYFRRFARRSMLLHRY